MVTKTILLLGAGRDQTFAIKTAKRMGLKVVVIDGNPHAPGFELADEYAVISTRDIEQIKQFADGYCRGGERIDGVTVMGSDIPQYVAEIADHLNLPHIPLEAAYITTNKYKMKYVFKEAGIPVPWFKQIESVNELADIISERGYPIVIKPVDRSGARGVFLLTEGCDYKALFHSALNESFSQQVIVEDFIEGNQVSTESIVYRGKVYTPGFVDRNYEFRNTYLPHIIENGGWQPSAVSKEDRCKIESLIEKVASTLEIKNGVIKGDIVLTDTGPMIIEVAARLSGGDFSESLVPLGIGINYVEAAIHIALGEDVDCGELVGKHKQYVANRYFFPSPGVLIDILGVETVRAHKNIRKLEIWYEKGDCIPSIKSHGERFGVFVVVADTKKELEDIIAWVYQTIKIVTSENLKGDVA